MSLQRLFQKKAGAESNVYCLVYSVGLGYILSVLAIAWCTYSSSGFFTAVLGMNDQRFLVAYPVGLFYGCFALMIVF